MNKDKIPSCRSANSSLNCFSNWKIQTCSYITSKNPTRQNFKHIHIYHNNKILHWKEKLSFRIYTLCPKYIKCSTNWCEAVLYIMPTHWSFYIHGNNSKLKCRVLMSLKSSSQIVKFKTPRTGVQALRLMKTFYWLSYII